MIKHLFTASLLFLLTGCAHFATTTPDIKSNPNVAQGKLNNGLQYYIVSTPEPKDRVYIRLIVKAGSINEDDDQKGIAHMIEHMAFNSTENFPDTSMLHKLASAGLRLGRDVNAYTSFENTVYLLNLANNNTETLLLGLDIISEWAGRITFDPKSLNTQRTIIMEEWRRRLSPAFTLAENKNAIERAGSRYAERNPMGDMAIVQTVSSQRVRDFYQRWYRPDNMIIIVTGAIDSQNTLQLINKKLAFLNNPTIPTPPIDYSIPLKNQWQIASVTTTGNTDSTIDLNFLSPVKDETTAKNYRSQLTAQIVTQLLNKQLAQWQRINDNTLRSAIYLSAQASKVTQQSTFSLQLKNASYAATIQSFFNQLAQIAQQGFQPEPFELEKNKLIQQLMTNVSKPPHSLDVANELVTSIENNNLLLSTHFHPSLSLNILKSIELKDINHAYQTILDSQHRQLIITYQQAHEKPTLSVTRVKHWWNTSKNTHQPQYKQHKLYADLPAFNKPAGHLQLRKEWPHLDIKEYQLSNGSRLIYKFQDENKNEVHFKALTQGGLMTINSDNYQYARIGSQLIDQSGIGGLDHKAVNTLLADEPIALSTLLEDYQQGFSGRSHTAQFSTLLHLFRLKLDKATVSEEVLNNYKREMQIKLSPLHADPREHFIRKIAAIEQPGQPTPYSLTLEDIEQLTPQKLINSYQETIQQKTDYTYFVVGDISEHQLLPLAKKFLATVPVKYQHRKKRSMVIQSGPEHLIMPFNPLARTDVEIRLHQKKHWNFIDNYHLQLASQPIQQQLRMALRDKAAGVYDIASHFWQTPNSPYAFGRIKFSSAPDRADELVAIAHSVLNDIAEAGLPTTHNKRISVPNQQTPYLNSNLDWLNKISESYQAKNSPELLETASKMHHSTDISQVSQVIASFLSQSHKLDAQLTPIPQS